MNTTHESESVVSSDTSADMLEYRSPSILAIITCVLGFLCIPSFLTRTLWFLPVITIVLGLITLRVLAKTPEKAGRKAVLIALTMAFLFGAWGPARYYSRHWWINRKAKEFALAWLDMVRADQLPEAHQLHVSQDNRIDPDLTFEEYYRKSPEALADRKVFFAKEPLRTILAHRKDATIQYVGNEEYVVDKYSDAITLIFVVKYRENGQEKAMPVRMRMVRQWLGPEDNHPWYLREIG